MVLTNECIATFMLFPGIRGSPLRVVTPGEEGKLRLGGGGGGDLEGFSVRYRGTVSSSRIIKFYTFRTNSCLRQFIQQGKVIKMQTDSSPSYLSHAWILPPFQKACAGACWHGARGLRFRSGWFGGMGCWRKVSSAWQQSQGLEWPSLAQPGSPPAAC